jgi:hypothetical protein
MPGKCGKGWRSQLERRGRNSEMARAVLEPFFMASLSSIVLKKGSFVQSKIIHRSCEGFQQEFAAPQLPV